MYTSDECPPKTVLVVDDEPMITRWVSSVLESRGYRVRTALNFGEYKALAADRSAVPDVVIFDLQFGAHNGFTMWLNRNQAFPDAAWIPCSGYISDQLLEQMKLERSVVLEKPFSGQRLLQVLELALTNQAQNNHAKPVYREA